MKEQTVITFHVNGHSLVGQKRRGKWFFSCPAFPELVREHDGDESPEPMVAAFMLCARCLAPARTFFTRIEPSIN